MNPQVLRLESARAIIICDQEVEGMVWILLRKNGEEVCVENETQTLESGCTQLQKRLELNTVPNSVTVILSGHCCNMRDLSLTT